MSKSRLVMAFRPPAIPKPGSRGELVAIEFVPNNFKLMDLDKEPPPGRTGTTEKMPTDADLAEQRRQAMYDAIRDRLRKPGDGEKRETGFIERSECTNRGAFMHIKTGSEVLKLVFPQGLVMGAYTPDIQGVQLGCGMKALPDIPVVFVYKSVADAKAKAAGELVSLEFVPKSFTLN